MLQSIDVSARALPAEHGPSSIRDMLRRVENAETTGLAQIDFQSATSAEAAPAYHPMPSRLRREAGHIANSWLPFVITVLGILGAGTLAAAMLGLPGTIFDLRQYARLHLSSLVAGIEADAGALPSLHYEPRLRLPAEAADPMAGARARAEAMLARLPEHTQPPPIPVNTSPRLRLGSILITRSQSETILPIRIESSQQATLDGFIILSGVPDDAQLNRGQRLGPGAWLLKPTELDDVRISIAGSTDRKFMLEAELVGNKGERLSQRLAWVEVRLQPPLNGINPPPLREGPQALN